MIEDPGARGWDFPRSVAGVALLVAHGASHGLAPDQALAGSGLTAGDLGAGDREVTAAQELRVVRTLQAHLGRTGVDGAAAGLAVGAAYHVSTFGIFGFAMLASRTVLDAMNVGLRFVDLSFAFAIPRAALEADRVVVRLTGADLPADVRDFLVARDAGAIRTLLQEVVPGIAVSLELGPDGGALAFAAAYLDQPLPQASPQTVAVCEALCRDVVSRRRERVGTAREVQVLIAQHLPSGAPMAAVARDLGLAERTLRRRLAAEGLGYRTLLDEVRESLAAELLARSHLGVEDVAQRLGYAEASSFIHAHRRWTGRTPARARTSRGGA